MNKVNIYNVLFSTPTFPEELYDNLPELLKRCTEPASDTREKDILLTGCLVVLSGCFSNCRGRYDKDWVRPNIYAFIVAPPASGKGVIKYSPLLGKVIQDELLAVRNEAIEAYDTALIVWKRQGRNSDGAPPDKPICQLLFIPGNSSAASIYKQLNNNRGVGIICETEADVLSGAIKQDWGNFSHMLRGAFHHETLSVSRSTGDVHFSIDHPCLSTLLTGTPDQVSRLIQSSDDGLMSRFLFYCFSRELKFNDPKPCSACPDLSELFVAQGAIVAAIKKRLDTDNYTFSLSSEQFNVLTTRFRRKLEQIKHFEGAAAASSLYRLGLITFRIAMTLTTLRRMETPSDERHWECAPIDFDIAMSMMEVFFEHAMVMYPLLPGNSLHETNPQIRRFFNALPNQQFDRKRANEIGNSLGLSEKTVYNYIAKLKEAECLENPVFGEYKKKNPA